MNYFLHKIWIKLNINFYHATMKNLKKRKKIKIKYDVEIVIYISKNLYFNDNSLMYLFTCCCLNIDILKIEWPHIIFKSFLYI